MISPISEGLFEGAGDKGRCFLGAEWWWQSCRDISHWSRAKTHSTKTTSRCFLNVAKLFNMVCCSCQASDSFKMIYPEQSLDREKSPWELFAGGCSRFVFSEERGSTSDWFPLEDTAFFGKVEGEVPSLIFREVMQLILTLKYTPQNKYPCQGENK